ncbi:MAG: YaiI/YqxD family protein [Oceanicoccus sp.]|uniref:YaiI/YqxD family protein n=1 Tax=Oceanicoccus sp. TaxID=2691044 RepID=UPI0026240317|nr:YaiI/YqxD family protein [Oceanicoccus sp.]MCP3907618.1 YaiI/YqxD family protein [Oceanicoccus sp.]MDG1773596.1 YaiI/YqxD family protein [Oceanicoccus sp.]
MHIWVDADACPNVIKEILFRAANRVQIPVTLVANQYIKTPPSPYIKSVQVAAGFDVADNHIAQETQAGDIVITADIPLAADIVAKGAYGINPRGTLYTEQNIKQTLTMRNFMEEMRSTGQASGGPPPLDSKDKQAFANTLDKLLAKAK